MENDNRKPNSLVVPGRSAGDAAHTLLKAVAASTPLIGGLAAELFGTLIQPPLERRRDEWMQSVALALARLSQDGVNLDSLKENEEFIDTVLQATHIALRSHQEEKHKALRNAILNTAIDAAPTDMRRQMFLRYIDEFTPEHLSILTLFDNPTGWFASEEFPFPGMSMGGLSHVLEKAFPTLKNEREIYDQMWKDLYQRGLVNTDGLHTTMSGNGLRASRTSELGKAFLRFVRFTGST
ncbi:MAG: hypothetical protein F4148_08600 [Caldilineaceae bacterium SB0675_bin_29]|uniref:DUF4393 domain-containing protein n=1 Tax=Caldilineaceae bacterium SB0675_bin_29 TaxID=2605266 RepID=A0A6B1FYT9_9CHLR|nr:hypothetical protein [Caldilineaceae bacterium SB0675_bin_29]